MREREREMNENKKYIYIHWNMNDLKKKYKKNNILATSTEALEYHTIGKRIKCAYNEFLPISPC